MLSNLKGYFRPKSIPEALTLLEKNSGSVLVIAGGTKLVNCQNNVVQELVDITGLDLNYLRLGQGTIRIGATTSIQSLASSVDLDNLTDGLLPQAARLTNRSILFRNAATLGGELVTTTSLSPLYCALLVLQGQVRLAGTEEFALAMNIFLKKKGLQGGLLVETVIPMLEEDTYTGIASLMDGGTLPTICACARVSVAQGRCHSVKIAVTGSERVPSRLHEAEDVLEGKAFTSANIVMTTDKAMEI
jgi:carbon-monoxide dehydrogenase medium subunit/2-furoyl-CoA dehydrogenase FAD binding subunit